MCHFMKVAPKFIAGIMFLNIACNQNEEIFNPAKFDKTLYKIQNNLFIKDKFQYSTDFIYQLELGNAQDTSNKIVRVIDSVVYYGNDTINFPTQIPENKQIKLYSKFQGKEYELILKRINKTDLYFEYYIDGQRNDLSHRFVSLELYYSLMNNFKADEVPRYRNSLTMYTASIDDSYFHIFIDNMDTSNIKAIISYGVYIIRPMHRNFSPILIQQ